MAEPVLNGDIVLIPSEICDVHRDVFRNLDWIGAIG
jgi:hypothetical protein